MIGYGVRCKLGHGYYEEQEAVNCIQLKETHEIGEIINDFWLICNDGRLNAIFKCKKGDYVKIIDIRYFDVFGTDMNYDDRKDLRKLKTEQKRYINNGIDSHSIANIYGYIEKNRS